MNSVNTKSKRYRNEDNLVIVRGFPCLICGSHETDPAHVKSRGSGGGDELWNLMPLCRTQHIEQHQVGWKTMSEKYYLVDVWLKLNGWVFDENNKIRRESNEG